MTTITHPERLLQETDLNRLRALVYREVEDSRQSQYVALVVVYYVAVLMVARYRDILENETDDLVPRMQSVGELLPFVLLCSICFLFCFDSLISEYTLLKIRMTFMRILMLRIAEI